MREDDLRDEMQTIPPVAAAAMLGRARLTPAGNTTASAAGETCHGQAATHVGAPGATVSGTTGNDVVVTNAALVVRTLAGDDLVCVTDPARVRLVDAGAGADERTSGCEVRG